MTFGDSPWDRFLLGDDTALSTDQIRGALLFYREAGFSTCHEGSLPSDQQFYNLGVRPMGSGPSDLEPVDYGAAHRSHVGNEARFAFRTRPLREVAVTGPWMHNGCSTDLEIVVRHHLDPIAGLYDYDSDQVSAEFWNQMHTSDEVLAEVEDNISDEILNLPALADEEVDQLLAFLEGLSKDLRVVVWDRGQPLWGDGRHHPLASGHPNRGQLQPNHAPTSGPKGSTATQLQPIGLPPRTGELT